MMNETQIHVSPIGSDGLSTNCWELAGSYSAAVETASRLRFGGMIRKTHVGAGVWVYTLIAERNEIPLNFDKAEERLPQQLTFGFYYA